MWLLAIAFTVLVHGHTRVETVRLDYPTRFTCEQAESMLDPRQLVTIRNRSYAQTRQHKRARSVDTSCGPIGGAQDYPYSDRTLHL